MFKYLRSFLTPASRQELKVEAATGSKLPPVTPPKVKPKQQSIPDYITTTTPSSAVIQRVDPQIANIDITNTYRLGRTTQEILRNLVRANPDLAAATSAYLRVGIPEKYIALARDPDGTVNDDATRLAMEILARFDKLPAYDTGFSQVDSVRSVSEALAKEGLLYGGMSMELVLDKARLPYKFQPVSVTRVKFYEDAKGGMRGLRPVQDVGGTEIDLDLPTFFMVHLDPSLLDPYPQSPFESAIQPVLASSTFLSDLRKVMARHVYPRYDITIDEEKLRANTPAEILSSPDDETRTAYFNNILGEIETTINSLGVEEALIHFDFIKASFIQNDDGQGTADKFKVIQDIINANLAKGARTMPAVLGNGSGSQNVASTETTLFMLSANSMVRLKLQEMFSKALTLACRLYGLEVTVEFEYDPIDLRPATELEAFKTMYQERIRWQWSVGLIGDMEASLRLTGKCIPAGFKTLAGTYFMTGGDPNGALGKSADVKNPYSGSDSGGGQSGGGAANQSRKPGTPEQSKSK